MIVAYKKKSSNTEFSDVRKAMKNILRGCIACKDCIDVLYIQVSGERLVSPDTKFKPVISPVTIGRGKTTKTAWQITIYVNNFLQYGRKFLLLGEKEWKEQNDVSLCGLPCFASKKHQTNKFLTNTRTHVRLHTLRIDIR